MRDVLDDLSVARRRLRVVSARSESRRRGEARSLLPHSFHFPLLCFTKLRRNDDQAQVDHKKRADLGSEKRAEERCKNTNKPR